MLGIGSDAQWPWANKMGILLWFVDFKGEPFPKKKGNREALGNRVDMRGAQNTLQSWLPWLARMSLCKAPLSLHTVAAHFFARLESLERFSQ